MWFPKRKELQAQKLSKRAYEKRNSRLNLIASENYLPPQVADVVACLALQEKYAEGLPYHRYYKGNEISDELEQLCIDYAKAIFHCEHANVQPHSGTTANNIAYRALIGNKKNPRILGLDLSHGGHLSHGANASSTSKEFNSAKYFVNENGLIDLERLASIAESFKPHIIVSGGSAYPLEFPWEAVDIIAQKHGAYHIADISHTAGLIAAKIHKNPAPHCDLMTTTTHKTLRCARGAMILVPRKKYRNKEKIDLAKKVDSAVFPGSQGGPLLNMIAGKLAGMELILKQDYQEYDEFKRIDPDYKAYQEQVLSNMLAMMYVFHESDIPILAWPECSLNPTHLCVLDLRGNSFKHGEYYSTILEKIGIIVNKNVVPNDLKSPTEASGLRIGTPAITTQGLKDDDCIELAEHITKLIMKPESQDCQEEAKNFVKEMCSKYPIE